MPPRLTLSLLLLTSCASAPQGRANTFGFRDQELDAGALGANHPLLERLAGTERASAQEADDAEEESPARHAHTPQ